MNLVKKCLLFGFSSMFVFVSCSEEQKNEACKVYGDENAFLQTETRFVGGKYQSFSYKLISKDITFYYDGSVENCGFFSDLKYMFNEYFDHSKNKNWDVNLNVKFEYSEVISDKAFSIRYVDKIESGNDKVSILGQVDFTNEEIKKTGEIDGAHIRISKPLGKHMYENHRADCILHEIGHAFGLRHILKEELSDFTIMTPELDTEKNPKKEFTEFDRSNLKCVYGEYKEESKPTTPSRNKASKFDKIAHVL